MYCQSQTLVKTTPQYKQLYCLKCRSWGCPDCAPERARDVRGLARRGHPNTFLTLTVRATSEDNPDEKARALSRAWRLLRTRIKKRFNIKKLPYLTVYERTKKGQPHLHILLRCKYIPHAWLSVQMQELLDSPIVGIERIKDKNKMANYVSKYISKDLAQFRGCKRYYRSQDYELKKNKYTKPPVEAGTLWTMSAGNMSQTIDMYLLLGYRVAWVGRSVYAIPAGSKWKEAPA